MLLLLASLTTASAGGPLDGCLREDIKEASSRLDCGTHMVLRDGPFAGQTVGPAMKARGKATGLEITPDADTAILNGVETKLAVGKRDGLEVSLIVAQQVEGGLLITNCLTLDGSDSKRCKQLLDAVATIGFPTAESMTETTVKVAGKAVNIPPGCRTEVSAEDGTAECVDGGLLRWQVTGATHEKGHEDHAFLELETSFRSGFEDIELKRRLERPRRRPAARLVRLGHRGRAGRAGHVRHEQPQGQAGAGLQGRAQGQVIGAAAGRDPQRAARYPTPSGDSDTWWIPVGHSMPGGAEGY